MENSDSMVLPRSLLFLMHTFLPKNVLVAVFVSSAANKQIIPICATLSHKWEYAHMLSDYPFLVIISSFPINQFSKMTILAF